MQRYAGRTVVLALLGATAAACQHGSPSVVPLVEIIIYKRWHPHKK
jgi:hypothetical protein